jgi:hypothetical protein
VDVEVKEPRLRLRHPAERVGVDADELHERLFRKARAHRHEKALQRRNVVVVEHVALIDDPGGLAEAAHELRVGAEHPRRLVDRVHASRAGKDERAVTADESLLPLGARDGVERDPSTQQQADQLDPLHVPLGGLFADEPEGTPFAEMLRGLPGSRHQLLERQALRHVEATATPLKNTGTGAPSTGSTRTTSKPAPRIRPTTSRLR